MTNGIAEWVRAAARFASLLIAASVASSCTPRAERLEDARVEVREALGRGERDRALVAIASLSRSLPDTPESSIEVARLLVAAGSAPEAAWRLEDAWRRDPERPDLQLALARVSLLVGDPSRARHLAARVASRSAEDALEAAMVLARAELALGDPGACLEILGEAETRFPDRSEARLARIATLIAEGQEQLARDAVEQLTNDLEAGRIDLSEVSPGGELRRMLVITLAELELRLDLPEQSLARLAALRDEDPADVTRWRAWTVAMARAGRTEDALHHLRSELAASRPPAELFLLASQLQLAKGDRVAARGSLDAYRARASTAAGHVPRIDLALREHDSEEALQLVREALAAHPASPLLQALQCEIQLERGDLEAARATLHVLRALRPADDPRIDFLEARLRLAEGDAGEAATRLAALAPRLDDAATHYWLARALLDQGDVRGARLRYGVAAQRDPRWAAPLVALLELALRERDWPTAVGQARWLLRLDAGDRAAWSALVTGLVELGQAEEAERVAVAAGEGFRGESFAQVLLVRSLRAQGRTSEALAILDARRSDEGDEDWEAERSLTLGMAGRLDEGIAVVENALLRSPEEARLHAVHASLLFAAGDAEAGAKATDRALALDAADIAPLRARCRFRAATADWAGAGADCQRYVEMVPGDGDAWFVLGVVQAGSGDPGSAIASYRTALALRERDPRPRNNLAALLAARGELVEALQHAQEAFRLAPDDPDVVDTLASLYLERQLPQRARILLEEARADGRTSPWIEYRLAIVYRALDRESEARGILSELHGRELADPRLRVAVTEALRAI